MRKILDIALLDLRLYFSSIGNIISLTALPIMMAIVLGSVIGGDSSTTQMIRVDVLDNDNSEQSAALIETLQDLNSTLRLCPFAQTEDDFCRISGDAELSDETGQQRLNDGVTSALIVIPAGYADSLASFQDVQIDYYSNSDNSNIDPVYTTLQTALGQVNGAAVASRLGVAYAETLSEALNNTAVFNNDEQKAAYQTDIYDNMTQRLKNPPVHIQYETTREGIQSSDDVIPGGFGQSVPGMAAMFTLFTVFGGMGLLLEERKQWTLQRLIAMPLSRGQILGGKILSRFTLGLIQFAIVLAVGFVVGLDFGDNPLLSIPLMISYVLCVTALTFAIAPLIRTEGQASSMATLLSMAFSALGGAWWSLNLPFIPDFMKAIGHLSPVAWVMNGFNELIFYGGGLADILLPCAVLLAAALVLFGIGIINFRYD